jgi:hypothetical protein
MPALPSKIADSCGTEDKPLAARAFADALRVSGRDTLSVGRANLGCMGIERSPARRKRDSERRKRAAAARTWGGPVTVRRVGDPPEHQAEPEQDSQAG